MIASLGWRPRRICSTIKALEKSGQAGKLWMATFDLSDDISKAIKSGTVKFAIDQQPYLQGYIPVAMMVTMKELKTTDLKKVVEAVKANPKTKKRFDEYGLAPVFGPRHISSGPGFVTKENIGHFLADDKNPKAAYARGVAGYLTLLGNIDYQTRMQNYIRTSIS